MNCRYDKKVKSYVRFGVSPFGIYRNSSSHPSGSATNGISNYDDLYADVELWLREGWVDYVVPQLYWENGHSAADYAELLRWWSSNSGQAQLYIGHGIYNISPSGKKAVWRTTDEIARQIDMQRLNMRSIGSVFYSAKYFMSNVCGLTDRIRTGYYTAQALVPPVKRLGSTEPAPAQELQRICGRQKCFPALAKTGRCTFGCCVQLCQAEILRRLQVRLGQL